MQVFVFQIPIGISYTFTITLMDNYEKVHPIINADCGWSENVED
jgi:hypothetical protein